MASSTSSPVKNEVKVNEKDVKRILQICNQLYVGLHVKEEEVIIKKFDNVFSTHIFHVSFINSGTSSTTSSSSPPSSPSPSSASPSSASLVIKFYDVAHSQQLFSVANSHLCALAVGQARLGPSILQIHNDALVMSYLSGRTLTPKDDHNIAIRKSIAKKLASFHALSVPIARNLHTERVINIFNSRYDEKLIESLESGQLKASLQKHGLKNILENDLSENVDFVRNSILRDENHQVVFSHCDFNHNNVLLSGDDENDVKFIDFDYSMYFYRGKNLIYHHVCF